MFLRRRHSAFLQIAPITAPPPVPAVFFLPMARIGPPPSRSARYQKLSNPPLPLFARSANYTCFLRLIFFRHKLAVLQNCTHFYIFHLFAKNSVFCMCRNFKGVFGFFIFSPAFSKIAPLLRVSKIGLYFNHTKRGGIFHFKPPKQHLKLKFIFLKSTQNLWKGFWENLTMCHILPHFAGKQCAFFN